MNQQNRKAILKVGYRCNNNCLFCHSAPHRGRDASTQQLIKKIELARRLGAETLVLSGGEPTIRDDFFRLLNVIERNQMSAGLVSNGRMLAYPDFRERLTRYSLQFVQVSLCGPDAATNDAVTRSRSFSQTLSAIHGFAGRVPELTVNVVVTLPVIARLSEILAILPSPDRFRLKFSFVEPEGNALDEFSGVVPRISQAAFAVRRVLEKARQLPGWRVAWDGFPLCLMPDFEQNEAALREDGFFVMSEAFEKEWHPIDDRHRTHATICLECSLRRKCRGVFREYLERRGSQELRPILRASPNSFNLVRSQSSESLVPRRCAIRAGHRPPPDPVRGLLLSGKKGRVFRGRVESFDFSDETLNDAVGVWGQIYRLVGKRLVPQDFSRELQKLVPHNECRRCPLCRRYCPGLYQPEKRSSFSRAQDILFAELGRLSGRVLDVGCGSMPYLGALEPGGRQGRLRYLGIDPVPGRIPRRDRSWARVLKGSLGLSRLGRRRYDAVLALRSLSHLPSLRESLERFARLVAPGGIVLLADDVVFGVERRRADMKRLAASRRLAFEHYRTLMPEEIRRLAETLPEMRLGRFYSPADTGSTLWILRLEKR